LFDLADEFDLSGTRRPAALTSINTAWQSAILLGMFAKTNPDEGSEPEGKLCLTIDAYAGTRHTAPANAVTRFKEAEAACATIAQLWPTIKPPDDAVL
jgi:hypothetical protein